MSIGLNLYFESLEPGDIFPAESGAQLVDYDLYNRTYRVYFELFSDPKVERLFRKGHIEGFQLTAYNFDSSGLRAESDDYSAYILCASDFAISSEKGIHIPSCVPILRTASEYFFRKDLSSELTKFGLRFDPVVIANATNEYLKLKIDRRLPFLSELCVHGSGDLSSWTLIWLDSKNKVNDPVFVDQIKTSNGMQPIVVKQNVYSRLRATFPDVAIEPVFDRNSEIGSSLTKVSEMLKSKLLQKCVDSEDIA